MLKNINIVLKMALGIALTFILLLGALALMTVNTERIITENKEIYHDVLIENLSLILNADRDLYQAKVAEEQLHVSGRRVTEEERQAMIKEYEDNVGQTYDRITDAMDNLSKWPELYEDFAHEGSGSTLAGLSNSFEQYFSQWTNGFDKNTYGYTTSHEDDFNLMRNQIDFMTETIEAYADIEADALEQQARTNTFIVLIASVIVLAFVGLVILFQLRYISKNIKALIKDMNTLARRDLGLQIDPKRMRYKDEFGRLGKALHDVIDAFREVIIEIHQGIDSLSADSAHLKENSGQVSATVDEISKTVYEMSVGASHQAERTEEATGDSVELGEIISQNISGTHKLSETSHIIDKATEEGLASVQNMSHITERNRSAFEEVFSVIETTSKSAQKIGEASQLISDIADQTNLLALNAAIEAARAGEAGKGFAVVAEEIRKLAEESAESTATIDRMLSDLTENVARISEKSEVVKGGVAEQVTVMDSTKKQYTAIEESVKSINQAIEELEQLSHTMEEKRVNVMSVNEDLSAIAEENAASAQETSASTEEVSASVAEMSQIAANVDELVVTLTEISNRFQI